MAQTAAKRITGRGDAIDYTPTAAVLAGDVVQIGSIPLVATQAIGNGALGSLACEGVFDLPKTSDVFVVGDAVYWNSSGNPVTGDSGTGAADNATGNLAGVCVSNANAAVSYVRTKLTAAKRTSTIAGSVTADDITGSDPSLGVSGKAGSAGAGGIVAIAGGAGDDTNNGGAVTVAGGAGAANAGDGGAITVTGGAATAGNDNGGAVTINGGAKHGTGADGAIAIGVTNAASITLGKMARVPFASVAANGGNIATAGALAEGYNLVTAADNSKGVQLPSCVNGARVVIINQTTDKTLKIYPPTAKQINGAGANNAITLVANGTASFASEGVNAWYGGLSASIMS